MFAVGMSPSGKAAGSGPAIRGFESLHPSQEEFSARFATMRQHAPKVRLAFLLVRWWFVPFFLTNVLISSKSFETANFSAL